MRGWPRIPDVDQEAAEHAFLEEVAELVHGLVLDLADAFLADAEHGADLVEGGFAFWGFLSVGLIQVEACVEHGSFDGAEVGGVLEEDVFELVDALVLDRLAFAVEEVAAFHGRVVGGGEAGALSGGLGPGT